MKDIIDINSIGEIEQYFIKESNTYDFGEFTVNFNCDVEIKSNLKALYIEGNEIICNNMTAEYDIIAERIVADDIECENLEAFECVCDNLKSILNVDVKYLECKNIENCGNIKSKKIDSPYIKCFECTCEELNCVIENIDELNLLTSDE